MMMMIMMRLSVALVVGFGTFDFGKKNKFGSKVVKKTDTI